MEPLITNDAVVLGLLIVILASIFYTSSIKTQFWTKFYKFIPALLLCYFVPSLFNSLGIISGEDSNLYFVASRYLLPSSLVLLCLSIDIKGIIRLGPKALIMFLAGTAGIVHWWSDCYHDHLFYCTGDPPGFLVRMKSGEVWQTVAGSWIGGGANQTAMKEVYGASDKLFSAMITVDVIVANVWMACLLIGAGYSDRLDKKFKADNSAITELKHKVETYQLESARIPNLTDLMVNPLHRHWRNGNWTRFCRLAGTFLRRENGLPNGMESFFSRLWIFSGWL